MNEFDKEFLLAEYYKNDARKLHQIVDEILFSQFGGKQSVDDPEGFYSIANEVMSKIIDTYDGVSDFRGLVYSTVRNKIMSEFTSRNRIKRGKGQKTISLSETVVDDLTFEDCIPDKNDRIGKLVERLDRNMLSEESKKYYSLLSTQQKKIADLIMEGCDRKEIQQILNISDKDYNFYLQRMQSYELKRHLRKSKKGEDKYVRDNKENMEENTKVEYKIGEKSKDTKYGIRDLIEMIEEDHSLRDDYILQRSIGQWGPGAKGELISDILQGRMLPPIIVDQEIEGEHSINWLIDGLQRCSTIVEYSKDEFEIYNNVKINTILYQEAYQTENGTEYVIKEFDIRKKRFSQLPKALQNSFMRYTINVMLSLNCSKEEIKYDIARYNRSRPMTIAQLSILEISENIGDIINTILNLDFFNNRSKSSYTPNDFRASNLKRMIIESVMVTYYLNDYTKDSKKIARFLSDNETDMNFVDFYELMKRLDNVANESTKSIFNSKNSFIFFALFKKFTDMNLANDALYIDFLSDFHANKKSLEYDGASYEEWDKKSNKDKSTIIGKLNLLEYFMWDYVTSCNSNIA